MNAGLILPFEAMYEEYLGDESKMKGHAQSISFPRTKEDVAAIVRQMAHSSTSVTVQGGKTGICGGAVPLGGHVLNLSRMDNFLGLRKTGEGYTITVQAGVMLCDLEKQLSNTSFIASRWDEESVKALADLRKDVLLFWPVEPTETSATVGGVLATNAQGICANLYGDTRRSVQGICVIDGSGTELCIQRGEHKVQNGQCLLPNGKLLTVDTDALRLPADVDVLDLFLGSEGLYGVIVEATLTLIRRPKEMWGIAFFFAEQEGLSQFAEKINAEVFDEFKAAIAAVEYIDGMTLGHIKELKKVATKLKGLPDVDETVVGMVYVELHGDEELGVERIAQTLMEWAIEAGSDEESTWALSGKDDVEKLRAFRHAAPESINIAIGKANQLDSRIMKLSTDITLQNKRFGEVVGKYQREAKENGLQIAIFGHVSGSHVHANILSQNYDQYERGKALVADWASNAIEENGIVFSEHGVGKLKKDLFERTADQNAVVSKRGIKKKMDEKGILNPGIMFDVEKEA